LVKLLREEAKAI